MKQSLSILILFVSVLVSCNDDPVILLTPELVYEIKAYDLDNNGSGSDIRVDFSVRDNINVGEYRIMIIPSSVNNSFDESIAASVSEASYLEITPEISKTEYSIKRLPASVLDVNGAPIQNNLNYTAVVYIVGVGTSQLSQYSAEFTLKDIGIYNGIYRKFTKVNCDWRDESDTQTWRDNGVWIELLSSGNEYTGVLRRDYDENITDGNVRFQIQEITIMVYSYECEECLCRSPTFCEAGESCPLSAKGEGIVIDDLILEVIITNEDCKGTCEGPNQFFRQP